MAASLYARTILIGLATGSRSQIGVAALAWTAPTTSSTSGLVGKADLVGKALANKWVRLSTALAASGELIGDKLPAAPSRSGPAPFRARLALGAVAGYALAEREGGNVVAGALLALGGSAFTTLIGPKYRALAAGTIPALGPAPRDLPGALLEDVFAVSVALTCCRLR